MNKHQIVPYFLRVQVPYILRVWDHLKKAWKVKKFIFSLHAHLFDRNVDYRYTTRDFSEPISSTNDTYNKISIHNSLVVLLLLVTTRFAVLVFFRHLSLLCFGCSLFETWSLVALLLVLLCFIIILLLCRS